MVARSAKKASPGRRRVWRLVAAAVVLGAIVFAVEGGEYGTVDLFQQRARKARLKARIDSLEKQVDSLARARKAIRTNPAVQERIAREEFGMVRGDKEILYRFAEPRDSVGR